MERGKIEHRNRKKQIVDFSGLKYGNITPTDMDGLIEYKNRAYVILEIKLKGVELPHGQELALVRMCDDLTNKKPTLLIIAYHEEYDTNQDIDAGKTIVRKYRSGWIWRNGNNKTTRQVIDAFLKHVDREG